MYCVILVPSTGHAIQIEKLLQKTGIESKLIPVPRHLSSDCGVCVRIPQSEGGAVQKMMEESKIDTDGIFPFN